MFGVKKRKYVDAVVSIAGILGPMTGRKAIEDRSGRVSVAPLGYVFGFVDAAFKVRGLDVDSDLGVISLKSLLDTFWPTKGALYLRILESSSGKDDLIDAAGYGRSDYMNVLNNDGVPFGLALAILARENPDSARKFTDEVEKLRTTHRFSLSVPRKSFAHHEAQVTRKVAHVADMLSKGHN